MFAADFSFSTQSVRLLIVYTSCTEQAVYLMLTGELLSKLLYQDVQGGPEINPLINLQLVDFTWTADDVITVLQQRVCMLLSYQVPGIVQTSSNFDLRHCIQVDVPGNTQGTDTGSNVRTSYSSTSLGVAVHSTRYSQRFRRVFFKKK